MERINSEFWSKKMIKKAMVWALGLFLIGATPAWAEDIVVVVNSNAPVDSLTAKDVKSIYLGEKTFWGSVKINPVGYQDGTPIQATFLDKVVKISENVYKTYWIKRIFREGGVPPENAPSPDDALRMVGQNKGGITYLPASTASGAANIKEVFRIAE